MNFTTSETDQVLGGEVEQTCGDWLVSIQRQEGWSRNIDQLQLFRSDNSIMSSDIEVTKHLKEKMKHFEFCVCFLLMLNIRLSKVKCWWNEKKNLGKNRCKNKWLEAFPQYKESANCSRSKRRGKIPSSPILFKNKALVSMVNYCIGHSFPLPNDCTQNEEWSSTEISPATLKQKLKNVFLNAFSKFPVSRWSYPVLPSSSRVIRGSLALGCCCWSDSLYAFLFTEPTVLFFAVSDGVSGKTVFRLNAEEK